MSTSWVFGDIGEVSNGDSEGKEGGHINGHESVSDGPIQGKSAEANHCDHVPFQHPRRAAIPYPVHVLPDRIKEAIADIDRIIQAPVSLIAASVLASVNLAAQAHADVYTPDGRQIPLSLFFLTEALSGERKSTVDGIALLPHYDWQDELRSLRHSQNAERVMANRLWQGKGKAFDEMVKKQLVSMKAGDDAWSYEKAFLEQVGLPPGTALGEPLIIARDLTIEGLVKQLTIWPSMGLFSDEGAVFFGGVTMNKDNALKTMGGLSELWDGKGVNRLRSGDGLTLSRFTRLAMHLQCQPIVFAQFIVGNAALKGQGFIPRCLITRVESRIGYRPYVAEDVRQSPGVVALHAHLTDLIKSQPIETAGDKMRVTPRTITLSPEARKLYVEMYDDIESRQRPGGEFRDITGSASKAPEQALRLAATFEVFEDPRASQISDRSFRAAREVILFHLNEVLRMEEDGRFDPDLANAELLFAWVEKNADLGFVTAREVSQRGPGQLRGSTDYIKKLLSLLADRGLIVETMPGTKNKNAVYVLPRSI